MQQANVYVYSLMKKSLMKLAAVSAKTLKTVKCLSKILFSIDVVYLFTSSFLYSLCKGIMSEVGLANLEISKPIGT